METLSVSDAKREFGNVILKSQQGPVRVNKNGKPVAVMISAAEYDELTAIREKYLKAEIDKGIADIQAVRVEDGKAVFMRLRERIKDA